MFNAIWSNNIDIIIQSINEYLKKMINIIINVITIL